MAGAAEPQTLPEPLSYFRKPIKRGTFFAHQENTVLQAVIAAHLRNTSPAQPEQLCAIPDLQPRGCAPSQGPFLQAPSFPLVSWLHRGTALTFPRHRSPCHLHGPGFSGPSDFTAVTYPKGELQVSVQSCRAAGRTKPLAMLSPSAQPTKRPGAKLSMALQRRWHH